MKRISKKMLNTFISKVADIKPSNMPGDNENCYYSKIDGSYFTRVGMEDELFKLLLKKGITEKLQNSANVSNHTVNIGFNPKEQKWYGWSHRAIFGFGVGSTCKKGDAHYIPKDEDDYLNDCILFWNNKDHEITTATFKDGGVQVSWLYNDTVKNKKLHSIISEVFCEFPDSYGKGEWTAKNLDDAKQMAIDFANGVS